MNFAHVNDEKSMNTYGFDLIWEAKKDTKKMGVF